MTNHNRPPLPPQNIHAEEAVLGSLIIDPEALTTVAPILNGNEFYLTKHRWIYEAIVAINERRSPLDFLTLTTELEQQGQLRDIGGGAYVSQLINVVPSALNAADYARLVAEAHTRRQLLQASREIAKLAYAEDQETAEAVAEAERTVLSVRQQNAGDEPRSMLMVMEDLYRQAEQYAAGKQELLLATGIKPLDKLLRGGYAPGTVNLVAARTSVGKSALLSYWAKHWLAQGIPSLFFSLEMLDTAIAGRMVLQQQGLDYRNLSEHDWPTFAKTSAQMSEWPGWIDDTPHLTVEELAAKARRFYSAQVANRGVIFLDYAQLTGTRRAFRKRYQEIGYVSRQLKKLAQELKLPILVAAQLGRNADGQRPTLRDLRGSGDLEQNADTVLFLHPQQSFSPKFTELELILAKHRGGPTGSFSVLRDTQLRFIPLVETEEEES